MVVRRGAKVLFRRDRGREVVAEGVAVSEGLRPLLPAFAGIVIGGRGLAIRGGREVFLGRDLAIKSVFVILARRGGFA